MRNIRAFFTFACLFVLAALFAFVLSSRSSAAPAHARAGSPSTVDAYAHWLYNGANTNEITVTIGTRFNLDLYINSGSNPDVSAQQSYLRFNYAMLQVASSTGTGCVITNTLTPDSTIFDATLQNEVCNGPGACQLRGVTVAPGSIAFASGALSNCPSGCGGDFRVATMGMCGIAAGRSALHWEFDGGTRDSEILNLASDIVSNPALYHDLYVNVIGPTATPTATICPTCPTATRTLTPPATLTPTITPTGQATSTPVSTPHATATPCAMAFNDVFYTDYFYTAVRYLYCEGAISGYADNTFRPYANTTRGQLSKIVVVARGWPLVTTGGPHFADVPATHPFYAYIETAYNHGIISGYNDGTFQPGNNVTRGQLSKIVVLAEGWSTVSATTPTFSDVPPNHPFFAYIETAYCHGIISGYADTTFRPGNNATRGQISKIVYQAEAGGQSCP